MKENIPGSGTVQPITNEVSALQTKIGWLQENVRLTKARDAVEDVQTNIKGMAQRIASLRTRGYVFEKDLENQATSLVRIVGARCARTSRRRSISSPIH